jgi:hypothetical protein
VTEPPRSFTLVSDVKARAGDRWATAFWDSAAMVRMRKA